MWPKSPVIYEINAWTWLAGLEGGGEQRLTLATVPAAEWDRIEALHVDAVWLMGVWERSPEGARIALYEQGLEPAFRAALPDFRPEDVPGSPYCIRRYVVDPRFGGPAGLASARRELALRGMKLLVDFVPNHVAPDHPWLKDHPDYFIPEGAEFAKGKDPYFAPWPDTVQVNGFHPGLRRAAAGTLLDIATQADGVRCDMAMLLLNDVFARTWGERAGEIPSREYWADVIQAVRGSAPGFLFVAEAYWDLEWRLQQLGFDYCYDKRLYDRMEHSGAASVEGHLRAEPDYQAKLIRFLENHDEPRAAATFSDEKQKACALALMTLPGAKLLHEGQMEGHRVKLPVQLGRRPDEAENPVLKGFYLKLLAATSSREFRQSDWKLCEHTGWDDNQTTRNLLAWCRRHGSQRWLTVINLSAVRSQGIVKLPWTDVSGRWWRLTDPIRSDVFPRDGGELQRYGLYVDLEPWSCHFLEFRV